MGDFLRSTGQWGRAPAKTGGGAKTVQDWLPVRDLDGGLIVRADGGMGAVIRVEAAPFGLLSDRERDRRIRACHESLQGIDGAVQILAVERPVALDSYLDGLEAGLRESAGARRAVLRGYLSYVRRVVGSGDAPDRRYYVLLSATETTGRRKGLLRDELAQRARDVAASLGRAELRAHVCDDAEVLDLLVAWLHPAHAARERVEAAAGSTTRYVFEEEEPGNGDH